MFVFQVDLDQFFVTNKTNYNFLEYYNILYSSNWLAFLCIFAFIYVGYFERLLQLGTEAWDDQNTSNSDGWKWNGSDISL